MRRGTKFGKKCVLYFCVKFTDENFLFLQHILGDIYFLCDSVDTCALIFFRTFDAMVPFIFMCSTLLFGGVLKLTWVLKVQFGKFKKFRIFVT